MQLPDPNASRAVLIGTSVFDHLEDLPAVRNNVGALAKCLVDKEIWGLDQQNLTQVLDPMRSEDILAAIDHAADAADDTLIVYYAGHGLVDPRSNLLLATKGSIQNKPYTATSYDAVRSILVDSRAARRVVILDCCYSGRALGTMAGAAGPSDAVAQGADAEGTFVLAAAAENKAALAPFDESYTAFTGELVKLFEEGHPNAPSLWDLDSLYRTLRTVLRSRGRPEPQKRDRNSVGQLCIARNRAKIPRPPESLPISADAGATLSGRYRLQRLIATGGMGQVWEAVDSRVGRRVAVKVLKSAFSTDPEFVERFRAEARTAAMLNHPNVASIFDYGETDIDGGGRTAYLVMELVDGEPLNSVIERTGRLPVGDALDMLEQTGRALEVAHSAGLVHRDVKPGNILITPSGQVKLIDFGIAKAVDAAPVQDGMVMGTAQYLAPEQALGRDATPASDVYSLAVVAYEALSGKRPFTGDGALAVAMKHIKEPPPPLPADLSPNVRELIETTLAKSPEKRYRSGGPFADAVAAVRSGRRPPHPGVTASRARTGKYVAWPLEPSIETIYGATCREELAVEGGGAVYCLAFSPDGSRLMCGGADAAVHRWDPIDGRYIGKLGAHRASCLAFSPDGQVLAVGSDKVVRLWAHEQPKATTTLEGHSSWVTCVAFSPDGAFIATGSTDATVRLWDALSGKAVPPVLTAHRVDATPGGYTGTVKSVAFSSDGALLATSGGNATVSLWSMPTLAHVRNIPARSATPDTPELTGIVETTFSPDGQTLATASGGTVHFWDIATAALSIGYRTLTNPTGSMTGVTFSPDGRTLATGSNDNAIRLWNPHSGELIIKRDGHTETVNSLAFSPAHAMLASASQDGTVRLWALAV